MTFELRRMDDRAIPNNAGEIRALLVVRNEFSRLKWLLDYYRKLGVDRFLVVDNGSTDGTLDYLVAQPDAHVWLTHDSYAASQYGCLWLDAIRTDHGFGHWCLVVDADEVLVFPFSEAVDLRKLTSYMLKEGYRGLFTFMLDMYPARPLRDAVLEAGQSFFEVATHFDAGPYFVNLAQDRYPRLSVNGGLRRRLFYQSGIRGRGPNLRKIPLILWQHGDHYKSAHACNDLPIADITGALLHFKYFADFHDKAQREVLRKEHWGEGEEYAIYVELVSRMPDMSFMSEFSRRYSSSIELVKLQLCVCSYPYLNFVRSRVAGEDAVLLAEIDEIDAMLRAWDQETKLPMAAMARLWRLKEIR